MAVLPILRWPDPRLEERCAAVSGDVGTLAADMLDTMYAAPGRGLAAPQVGQLLRLFDMDVTWKEGARSPVVCINPAITWRSSGRATGAEGCLSIPGERYPLRRAPRVILRALDLEQKPFEVAADGWLARIFQHENDHLDGVLYADRLEHKHAKDVAKVIRKKGWGSEGNSWMPGVDHPEG